MSSSRSVVNREGFLEYFEVNRLFLRIAGICPIDSRSDLFNGSVTSFMMLFVLNSSFLPLCVAIFKWTDIGKEETSEIVSVTGVLLATALKMILLVIKRKEVESVVKNCRHLWDFVKTEEDLLAVKPYALQGRQLTYGFGAVVGITEMTFLITPLILLANGGVTNSTGSATKKFPTPMGFVPADDLSYGLLYALQIPDALVCFVEIVSIDTLLAVFIMHACGHLRMVQGWLYKCETINDSDVDKKISRYITHHQRILSFTESLKSLFSGILFIQIVQSVLLICFDGYNLLLDPESQIKYMLHIVAGLAQLSMYCWPPSFLIAETQAVAEAAYSVPWYRFSLRSRKLILVIIMRAQKPAIFTAANFTKISLATFTSTISTAFSYYAFLSKMV